MKKINLISKLFILSLLMIGLSCGGGIIFLLIEV